MIRRSCLFAVAFVFLFVGVASAQHMLLDMIANKVIDKYQNATCEQLWQEGPAAGQAQA